MTPVGLQLYTLRALAGADLLGTLERVARIGYDGVELAGLHGAAPARVRECCDALGLDIAAAHVPLERLEREADTVADELRELRVETLVLPSTPRATTVADVERTVARLAQAVSLCGSLGLRTALHNHAWEFERVGTTTLWEAVTATPGFELELDLGWAWVAGEDPAALLREHAGRVRLVHVKDHVRRDGATPDVPVGSGEVGYDMILGAAVDAGVEWLLVEQDEPGANPVDASVRSLRAVRRLLHP